LKHRELTYFDQSIIGYEKQQKPSQLNQLGLEKGQK
jgi:hypothetical protein